MNLEQCPHEDGITYGKLDTVDGIPQYEVTCQTCGKHGVIYLAEDSEKWD